MGCRGKSAPWKPATPRNRSIRLFRNYPSHPDPPMATYQIALFVHLLALLAETAASGRIFMRCLCGGARGFPGSSGCARRVAG